MIDFVSFWKKYFNAGNAEWYPFDDGVVDAAWIGFLNTRSYARAMDAIRVILNAGLSLPKDLNPFVLDALDAWAETRGSKQEVSAMRTKDTWEGLVSDVHYRRMEGKTRDAAIKSVAYKNHKDMNTLRRRYNSSDYEEIKEAVFIYLLEEISKIGRKNHEELTAFVSAYPNFIKEIYSRNSKPNPQT